MNLKSLTLLLTLYEYNGVTGNKGVLQTLINIMLEQMFMLKSENIGVKIDHKITYFLPHFLRNRGQKSSLCMGTYIYRVS